MVYLVELLFGPYAMWPIEETPCIATVVVTFMPIYTREGSLIVYGVLMVMSAVWSATSMLNGMPTVEVLLAVLVTSGADPVALKVKPDPVSSNIYAVHFSAIDAYFTLGTTVPDAK